MTLVASTKFVGIERLATSIDDRLGFVDRCFESPFFPSIAFLGETSDVNALRPGFFDIRAFLEHESAELKDRCVCSTDVVFAHGPNYQLKVFVSFRVPSHSSLPSGYRGILA